MADNNKDAKRLTEMLKLKEQWQRRHAYVTIKEWLDKRRYTKEYIEASIEEYLEDSRSITYVEEILGVPIVKHESLKKEYPETKDNLLESGKFYYHPRLQVIPPDPMMKVSDTGEIEFICEPFFLEIIPSFAAGDLLNYFYERTNQSIDSLNRKRDLGSIKYLLARYPLDLILYSIDNAIALCYDSDKSMPRNPLEIEEFIEDTTSIYEQKITHAKFDGLDKVIPRGANNGR